MSSKIALPFSADPRRLADMSTAYDEVCATLGVDRGDAAGRERIATVIVAMARRYSEGAATLGSRALLVLRNT